MRDVETLPTEFSVSGETLRGHFVKPLGDGPFPGICKFHGLPGSSDQVSGIATSLAAAGFTVLTFDFRGFRRSDGIFSLAGEIEDARAAISHILRSGLVSKNWIGVLGASFGAAVAVCSAAKDMRASSVCIRAPVYDTMKFIQSQIADVILHDVVSTLPNEMHGVKSAAGLENLLSRLRTDSERYNPMNEIDKLSPRGVFIITGDSDVLIDIEGVKRLYEMAKDPKKMVVISGADHNLTDDSARRETEDNIINWFGQQFHGI